MTECFVDDKFYILKKQLQNETTIFGITKMEPNGEEYTVTISCIAKTEKETIKNLYTD